MLGMAVRVTPPLPVGERVHWTKAVELDAATKKVARTTGKGVGEPRRELLEECRGGAQTWNRGV
jgi:hypothetical protein